MNELEQLKKDLAEAEALLVDIRAADTVYENLARRLSSNRIVIWDHRDTWPKKIKIIKDKIVNLVMATEGER